jgi:hypothetical protein
MLTARVREGATLILTTHILEVAERIADRIGILAHGVWYSLVSLPCIPASFSAAMRREADFRLVWLAGRLWLAGESPYGPSFARNYVELFGPSINMYWSYPPSWFPISALFGLASLARSPERVAQFRVSLGPRPWLRHRLPGFVRRASQLLWRSVTSRVRSSPATAPAVRKAACYAIQNAFGIYSGKFDL